ncbi:TPA: hypothetical protein ACH3X1_001208 [Trebouxia sp. C0004]
MEGAVTIAWKKPFRRNPDDLTPLQQKHKAAAWDKFKEARAGNLKTRWEAEKLYIKQGEEWVAHTLDIVEAKIAGGCIVVCGDMNARTAELDDYIRLADLQDYVDVSDEGAYLNFYVPKRSNCDKKPPGSGTWGCELLELCWFTELLNSQWTDTRRCQRGIYLH